jgi:hypothetical protein
VEIGNASHHHTNGFIKWPDIRYSSQFRNLVVKFGRRWDLFPAAATNMPFSIPKACNQSWFDMIPADGGRFWTGCNKLVVDFTVMTDAEIVDLVGKSIIRPCGRLRQDQLGWRVLLHE